MIIFCEVSLLTVLHFSTFGIIDAILIVQRIVRPTNGRGVKVVWLNTDWRANSWNAHLVVLFLKKNARFAFLYTKYILQIFWLKSKSGDLKINAFDLVLYLCSNVCCVLKTLSSAKFGFRLMDVQQLKLNFFWYNCPIWKRSRPAEIVWQLIIFY